MLKNNIFSLKEIRKLETLCIKKLNHKLDYYTAYHYIEFFLENGIIFSQSDTELEKIYKTIYDIINYFLKDTKYLNFKPLEIAISCIAIVLEKYKSKDFFEIYNINEKEYKFCFKYLKE